MEVCIHLYSDGELRGGGVFRDSINRPPAGLLGTPPQQGYAADSVLHLTNLHRFFREIKNDMEYRVHGRYVEKGIAEHEPLGVCLHAKETWKRCDWIVPGHLGL
jgi:hypothetical protein